jgi:hypothetical protein
MTQQLRDVLASLDRLWPLQPGATRSRCLPLVVGYTWDGFREIRGTSGLVGQAVPESGHGPWDGASGIPQGGIYARVGDILAVIQAFGVDAEQDFDAVPGSLGDAGRRYPGGQPERYGRVAQIVGTTG